MPKLPEIFDHMETPRFNVESLHVARVFLHSVADPADVKKHCARCLPSGSSAAWCTLPVAPGLTLSRHMMTARLSHHVP